MLALKKEVLIAENRIRPFARETQLDFSLPLSKLTNTNVYLKCENLQHTGSFKVRGAFNKLLSMPTALQEKGVVAASTGNHAAAMAYALKKLKMPGRVFVPEHASPTKVDNIRNYEIPIEFYGTEYIQTENRAIEYAKEHNMTYVSPYNDLHVIAGQGTIGIELLRQLDKIDVVLAPVGGGGLIAGVAGFLKAVLPDVKIIGCLPLNSPVMAESIKADKIIEMDTLPTLSDATAGGIEQDAITFEFCKATVDDYILLSEDEIKNAIISLIKTQHLLVEGASGVALAALLKNAAQFKNKNVVVILSGANISLESLKTVLS